MTNQTSGLLPAASALMQVINPIETALKGLVSTSQAPTGEPHQNAVEQAIADLMDNGIRIVPTEPLGAILLVDHQEDDLPPWTAIAQKHMEIAGETSVRVTLQGTSIGTAPGGMPDTNARAVLKRAAGALLETARITRPHAPTDMASAETWQLLAIRLRACMYQIGKYAKESWTDPARTAQGLADALAGSGGTIKTKYTPASAPQQLESLVLRVYPAGRHSYDPTTRLWGRAKQPARAEVTVSRDPERPEAPPTVTRNATWRLAELLRPNHYRSIEARDTKLIELARRPEWDEAISTAGDEDYSYRWAEGSQ